MIENPLDYDDVLAGGRKAVLVIEDDADLRRLLEVGLEREGFEIAAAPDGERALALAARRPPDAVVCDLFMPERDGFETIQEFCRQHPRAKIVAISGRRPEHDVDWLGIAREIGALRTLKKPFEVDELAAVLRELLSATPPTH